jgi:hypothetical protein
MPPLPAFAKENLVFAIANLPLTPLFVIEYDRSL